MPKLSSKEWRKSRKYLFNNQIHFVFLTKHRGNILTEEILTRLEAIFRNTCKKMKCEVLKFEGKSDYVHLLVSIHPTVSISVLSGKLKGTSSHLLLKQFETQLKDHLLNKHFWASSYMAVSEGNIILESIQEFLTQDKVMD